jgi:hypothetical protein
VNIFVLNKIYQRIARKKMLNINKNNILITTLLWSQVFAHSVQEGINACSNTTRTGCTHICVGMPHGNFRCLCPDNMKPEGKTCLCASGEKPFANGTCPTGKLITYT